jgi:tetratricopeptide (TPR) repeat protein
VLSDGVSGAYLAGRHANYSSDFKAAAQYYTRALTRDSSNPVLLENAVLAQLSLGEISRALPIARKMDSDGLQSQISQMVLIADLVDQGDYAAILARIEQDKGVGPLVDGLLGAWAQLGSGQMSDALAAFDTVSTERGLSGFALYHKALALASVGDFEGAEAIYADDSTGAVQMTRRGAMSRIEVLSQLDRNTEALDHLTAAFGTELDPGLRLLRDRLETGETLPFTHVTSARDGMAEVFYTVAGALQSEASPDYTLLYTRVAEFLRSDHVDALLLTADLLEEMGRFELATAAYKRVPADHPAFHAAELGRAEALRRTDKTEAAIEVLEQLARTHGDLAIVHSTLGDFLRQQKNFKAAITAYNQSLAIYGENSTERSQWFLYYARGICYERLDDWEAAHADFRSALELNPSQPQVLNYLGYSLVEKQQTLDVALEMIERAVSVRPDSGYIVDSLGWALYRMARYEEAVDHMERAVELMAVDPVVNDHLGDVYWAVGRYLEAEFQWRRALSFVDEDTAEEAKPDRIRRKLEVGLDAVLAEEGEEPLKVANDG